MFKAITDLIKVKTIVTLVLTGVFSYLAITGKITVETFIPIFSTVIAFYFGTQYERSNGGHGNGNDTGTRE